MENSDILILILLSFAKRARTPCRVLLAGGGEEGLESWKHIP
jgi:hypothetical protein